MSFTLLLLLLLLFFILNCPLLFNTYMFVVCYYVCVIGFVLCAPLGSKSA